MKISRSRKNKKQGLQEVFPISKPCFYNIAKPLANDAKQRARTLQSSYTKGERKRSQVCTKAANRKGWTDVYPLRALNDEISLHDLGNLNEVCPLWAFELHQILEPKLTSPFSRKTRKAKVLKYGALAISLRN